MKKFCSLIVLIFAFYLVKSQELYLVATSGNYFESQNFSVSWSLGEPVSETFVTENIILTQGFQQSTLKTVGVNDPKNSKNIELQVYPNPTKGKTFVAISNAELLTAKTFQCVIHDLLGNQLRIESIPQTGKEIDFSDLSGSIFFILVKGDSFQKSMIIQKLK